MSRKLLTLFGNEPTYTEKILSLLPGIIQYLPMNEVSGTTALDASGNGRTGAYSGVTLAQIAGPGPSMGMAGLWDGVNDYVNGFSASLAGAWNNTQGTIGYWAKVRNAGVWSDGGFRFGHDIAPLTTLRSNFLKNSTANEFIYGIRNVNVRTVSLSTTEWFHVAITWNNTTAKCYLNGAQQGADITMAGALSGTLTAAIIGAFNNAVQYHWSGYLQQWIIASQAWTPAQMLIAATAS